MEELNQAANQLGEVMPKVELNLETDDPFIRKFKKWALIILSSLVGGCALILIVISVIKKIL